MPWTKIWEGDGADLGDRVRFAYLDGIREGVIVAERQHAGYWHVTIIEDGGEIHIDVAYNDRLIEKEAT